MDLREKVIRDKPYFLNESIKPLNVEDFYSIEPFITETIWEDNTSINVFLVEGTKHPDYQGMTWLEFLEKGKRMRINLELFQDNPGYYLDTEHKIPTMSYLQIDGGPYYVDADGNHRTCIARMFFFLKGLTMLHGVSVSRCQVDREAARICRALEERFIAVRPFRKKRSRYDTTGWMREEFEILFEVIDKKGKKGLLSKKEAVSLLQRKHTSSFLTRFFGRQSLSLNRA